MNIEQEIKKLQQKQTAIDKDLDNLKRTTNQTINAIGVANKSLTNITEALNLARQKIKYLESIKTGGFIEWLKTKIFKKNLTVT